MLITQDNVKEFINDLYGLDISAKNRNDDKSIALMIYYYLCYKYCTDIVTPSKLCKSVGRKQGQGVYYALDKLEKSKKYDRKLFRQIQITETEFINKFDLFNVYEDYFVYSKDLLILNRNFQKKKEKADKLDAENSVLNNKNKRLKHIISNLEKDLKESKAKTLRLIYERKCIESRDAIIKDLKRQRYNLRKIVRKRDKKIESLT